MRALDAIRDAGEVFSFILVLFFPASDAPVVCVGDALQSPHFIGAFWMVDRFSLPWTGRYIYGRDWEALQDLAAGAAQLPLLLLQHQPAPHRQGAGGLHLCAPWPRGHCSFSTYQTDCMDVLGGNVVSCAHSFLLRVRDSHPQEFGQAEYLKYQEALTELASVWVTTAILH